MADKEVEDAVDRKKKPKEYNARDEDNGMEQWNWRGYRELPRGGGLYQEALPPPPVKSA